MKNVILLALLACFALWHASTQGAIKYWDINGATSGAGGATPAGTWNTGGNANWTTSSAGTTAGTTWASGDDAVFSAGTDATGAFTNVLDNAVVPSVQNAGNLTVEEGSVAIAGDPFIYLNIGGGVAGKGIINVAGGASATISAELDSTYGTVGDDTGLLTKTGTGTLTLSSNSFYGATTIIAEGVVIVGDVSCLGSTTVPTIISNGATLRIDSTFAPANAFRGEALSVNGDGFGNGGAVRSTSGCRINAGGITLDSASRLTSVAGEFRYDVFAPDRNFDCTLDGSGNHRLNVNGGFRLGTGKLTKAGTGWMQTEGVSYICSALDFNDGIIRFRELPGSGFVRETPTETNYCAFTIGAQADEFRTVLQNDIRINNDITLNAPNLLINLVSNSAISLNGVVSGSSGGLTKGGHAVSTLYLNNANTYGGNTTVQEGVLSLTKVEVVGNPPTATNYYNGSISNSAVIDVQGPTAAFNVSSNFVLEAGQTLKCNGTCNFSNNLTLLGNLSDVGVNKLVSTPKITVLGTVTNAGSGTMTVTRIGGPALLVGDNFPIFNQAVSGGQTLNVVGSGAVWTNKLWVDGSIEVLVAPGPDLPVTNVIIQVVGPTSFNLGGTGSAYTPYNIYASTNVTLPMTNWTVIGTTISDAGGVVQFPGSSATGAQRFYRFGQP